MNDSAPRRDEGDVEYVERELGTHMQDLQNELGGRLRGARLAKKLGLRELSRRIGVSASMVSQLERGTVMPSVATLYRLASELRVSLDELFTSETPGSPGLSVQEPGSGATAPKPARRPAGPVQRKDSRPTVALDTGVVWQRLTASPDPEVEFLWSRYPVGGESCPHDALPRHSGREFGYVENGRLGVTVGFETYELEAGDSISFESTIPHRLFTIGDEPAEVVWLVLDRRRSS
jgi:transcriptional regulator with XRE-family HTH domain/quercetin dioxygenase-like cupin family protein